MLRTLTNPASKLNKPVEPSMSVYLVIVNNIVMLGMLKLAKNYYATFAYQRIAFDYNYPIYQVTRLD